jgi:hypothetical protein
MLGNSTEGSANTASWQLTVGLSLFGLRGRGVKALQASFPAPRSDDLQYLRQDATWAERPEQTPNSQLSAGHNHTP